ncbi:MAG: molecular chaperone DnaK, partial [Desulfobacterales bacterium]|nr:molecular chaperone DnaK [Desulfobacterales bacterium]
TSQESPVGAAETEVYDDTLIEETCKAVQLAFDGGNNDPSLLKGITKQIERIVDQRKGNWPLGFLRRIADTLLAVEGDARGLSAAHEFRWLNLAGFCMRPGFGDAFDEERARKLWKIYLTGLKFPREKQNRLEWWIFLRRIAGGLKAGQQRQFFQDVSAQLVKEKKGTAGLPPQEWIELWMAAANMERLLVKDKVALAKSVLPRLLVGNPHERLFWVLGRLGARELLYGSVDRVVMPAEVERWIGQLLKKKWKNNPPTQQLVSDLAQKTGDRTRDLDGGLRERVLLWYEQTRAKEEWIRKVTEKGQMRIAEKSIQFGEKLPSGLVLK